MEQACGWIERTIGMPQECPDQWVTERYQIGLREFVLAQPRRPDQLLDDPAVLQASQQTDYMPYWAYLWPGAPLLAERILEARWLPGTRGVEIGCGLGLAGLAALAAGLHVTFTDHSPAALALAAHNAGLNGFSEFHTQRVDWRDPMRQRYPVLLGADVLYEQRCLEQVIRVLDVMLARDGTALLSDPCRAVADSFPELARQRGYRVECEPRPAVASGVAGRIFWVQAG